MKTGTSADLTADALQGFFLCMGPPKSGTTFLQRTLNLHPQVSCPAEHYLPYLADQLDQALTTYGQQIAAMDERSAGQGATLPDHQVRLATLRAAVLAMSRAAAHGKPVHGLNDNSLFFAVGMTRRLFGPVKLLVIVRNPVDLAISTWRYNRRLSRQQPELEAEHLAQLGEAGQTLDDFVLSRSAWYQEVMRQFLGAIRAHPDFLIVRYYELVNQKRIQLGRIFRFLGVDHGERVMDAIMAASTREAMARNSVQADFYRVSNADPLSVSPAVRSQVLAECRPVMKKLGYDPTFFD